jgi:tRNA A37 N6-isopentenylltransferase MiaA
MYPGLTMVVGPPGTGKTDVAVQIVSNWYGIVCKGARVYGPIIAAEKISFLLAR